MIVYNATREPSVGIVRVFPGETPTEAAARAEVQRLRAELETVRGQFARLQAEAIKAHFDLERASAVATGFEITRQRVELARMHKRLHQEVATRCAAELALDAAITAVHGAESLSDARRRLDRAMLRPTAVSRAKRLPARDQRKDRR